MVKETVLDITENYPTFGEFYLKNQPLIFKTLIDGYRELSNNLDLIITIKICACVENYNFDNSFYIKKDDEEIIERLNNIYIPYYEKNEEYEICDEIREIYKKIKGV
jgi:hypothetical protein